MDMTEKFLIVYLAIHVYMHLTMLFSNYYNCVD